MNKEYIFIPFKIWYDNDLGATEKLMSVHIWNDIYLNEEDCELTNEDLSSTLGLTKRSCTRILSSLKEKGLIDIEIVRNERNQVIKRLIKMDIESFK